MSVINTNITAMIGQQNLSKSQSALQTSMERLSSGLRINSASDDAAGQAIANRMSSQITGLSQAQRNANDGISVAQTAEGALNQVNDNLQRIRELTVQAQNDTNSQSDLESIQAEIGQRLSEIDRISSETNFNGVKVLSEDRGFTIQVGANDGEQITIDLKAINSETLGLNTFSVASGLDEDAIATTNTTSIAATPIDASGLDEGSVGNGNGNFGAVQVDASGNYFAELTGDSNAAANGYYEVEIAEDGTATLGALAATQPNSGDLTPAADMGDGIAAFSGADAGNVYAYSGTGEDAPAYLIKEGTGEDAKYYEAQIAEDGTVTRGDELRVGEATTNPLAALDSALSTVDSLRSDLGAIQNRFESAISNLSTTETNLSAARSRIEDADYATEVSNMTRAQILQQAGTSVLAQANQLPQNVLSLLG